LLLVIYNWYSGCMGIFDRLGDVLKSYLNDDDERIFGRSSGGDRRHIDPDLDEAFDELNDFLRGGPKRPEGKPREPGGRPPFGGREGGKTAVPEFLRGDFAELGVPFGAGAETCKGAYKKLLKIHHPDRHAGHSGNMKKATEKTARINAAFDRIEKWRAAT
jgi:DnaJ-domain-containing protein 1